MAIKIPVIDIKWISKYDPSLAKDTGEMKKGESQKKAVSRELYEELGISVNKDCIKILPSIDRHKNERMYYILFPKYRTPDFRLGEGSGFIWFSFDQALSLDTDTGLKEYLRKLKDIVKP